MGLVRFYSCACRFLNQRSRPVFRRRGAQCAPASLPPPRGKVPSGCEADEGGLRNHRGLCDEPAQPVGAAHWAARRHARAGLGPAPTKEQKSFRILGRGGCPHPPADCAHPLVPLKVNWPEGPREGGLGHWLLSGHSERSSPPERRNPPARNETALSSPPHPSGLRPATFPPRGKAFRGERPSSGPQGEGF